MTSETTEKEAVVKKERSNSFVAQKELLLTKAGEIGQKIEPFVKPAIKFLVTVVLPAMVTFATKAWWLWNHKQVDDHVLKSIIGFAFCFFGGMYPTVFAAIQAAEQGGRALLMQSIGELSEEAGRILEESKKDDDATSTSKMDGQEYAKHKTLFVLQKMNPEKVNSALTNMYKVWFAVISVLVVQFARTIQTANSIAEFLTKPSDTYAKPVVLAMLPPEYHQWTPILIEWSCKTVGMSLAWLLTSIRVAFASALQGGLILARSGIVVARKNQMDFMGIIANTNENPSKKKELEDRAAYMLAALGFLFQMYFRLTPPFPLNFVLFPFRMAEWSLRYGMMKMSTIA